MLDTPRAEGEKAPLRACRVMEGGKSRECVVSSFPETLHTPALAPPHRGSLTLTWPWILYRMAQLDPTL